MKELLTLSEFIDDNQLAVKVLRRSPQPEYELHSHEFAELVIVYGGRGEHFTPHNSTIIEAGDVFVIHGSMKHGYRKVEALELVNIMFNISGFDNPPAGTGQVSGVSCAVSAGPAVPELCRRRDAAETAGVAGNHGPRGTDGVGAEK